MNPTLYQRPNKPDTLTMNRRPRIEEYTMESAPEPLIVDKATECHVTPMDVARRMVTYLDADPRHIVLEPSAGTGNLVQALIDSGHPRSRIIAIERHYDLKNQCEARTQAPVFMNDFLQFEGPGPATEKYHRILMNPPFRKTKQHIEMAFSLLAEGGDIVALVPITFTPTHLDFWELEVLPNDTFAHAKVHTKIILIRRAP